MNFINIIYFTHKIGSAFRPRIFTFPYKREVYHGPTTLAVSPPTDDPAEENTSDQPPQKRQRIAQAPGSSAPPTQGTIRSNSDLVRLNFPLPNKLTT
jgi:hypothetical protein